ncbi:MAG: Gfo/Idh/MocA family oxidoreductase [Opitutaceae bacterium]|nr:Gfo/Idh/MocA family oxidoreductase [Opitutaceae bacterium]
MARIAFLSTAHIHTKSFVENILQATDDRVVAAVWDDAEERGRRYAAMAKAPFVADLDDVLADPAIDGFIICAENTRHLPLLKLALPTGKPVFCEKPLVTSAAELADVKELLARYPTTLFCGYFMPFSGEMRTVAALVREGAFGTITRIRCRNAHHAAYGRWFDNPDLAWFHDPALSGGGAFMDMGTHAVHLARTLFGPVTEAFAIIGNHSGEYPGTDDFGIAQLKFASGVIGTIEAAWTQTGGIGGLEIVGSKRSLWNTPVGYVIGSPQETPKPLEKTQADVPTRVDRLVATIRGELTTEERAADLAACLDAVAIMDACYASSRAHSGGSGGGWVRTV